MKTELKQQKHLSSEQLNWMNILFEFPKHVIMLIILDYV